MNLLFCPDSTPSFLSLFDLSIAPPLLFYTYIPVIMASFLIGFYVLFKDKFSLISVLLFTVAMSFTLWVINIFFAWIAAYLGHVMFSWQITPIFEILIFISSIYFIYVFIDEQRRDINSSKKLVLILLTLPLLLILPTRLSIKYFDSSICEGVPAFSWYYYMYALEGISILWIIWICLRKYKSLPKNNEFKKQILYVMIGMVSFLALFLGSNLIGQITLIQKISFIGSLGMVLFLGFLGYLIVRYQAFNIKLIAAQALITALVILSSSLFFVIEKNSITVSIMGSTLALTLGIGYMLAKSVKLEVQRKEELQSLSDQLSVANDKLHELDKAKSEFISIASHQLRTPLTSIKGFGSLLLEGTYGPLPDMQRNALEKIYISNERLIQLVEDLLNISRIEAGRMEFDFQDAQVEDLVQEAVDTLELSAKAKNLYLHWQKPAVVLPKVKIDITKIKEVISNMVDNAIKYTPKGGVTVRVERGGFFDHTPGNKERSFA